MTGTLRVNSSVVDALSEQIKLYVSSFSFPFFFNMGFMALSRIFYFFKLIVRQRCIKTRAPMEKLPDLP